MGVLLVAAIGLWLWKPWVLPIENVRPEPDGRRIDAPGIAGNFFPGRGVGARPGVLLLGGSEGGLGSGAAREARSLAARGYSVFQLAYFRLPGQPKALELVPVETFTRGLDWLARQPGVDRGRLAVVGGSKGAEAALLLATRRADVRAVVAQMPSAAVWNGFSWESFGSRTSSWSEAGRPLPYLAFPRGMTRSLGEVYARALATLPAHPDAAIAVERIGAPVLLVCGEMDALWPSCPMARMLRARAAAAGGPAVTLLAYPKAGHAVGGVPLPSGNKRIGGMGGFLLGGEGADNNAARMDAWPRVVAFLDEALARPAAGDARAG